MPQANRLVDLLIDANQPEHREQLYLVVLDGVNRAAADAYLLPLLACSTRSRLTRAARALALAHPAHLSPDDPYADVAQLVWPRNVLLAGTLVQGSATVPLPPELWADAALVLPRAHSGTQASTAPPVSEVPLTAWESLANAPDRADAVPDVDKHLEISAGVWRRYRRLLSVATAEQCHNPALLAAQACLVPYLIASGQAASDDTSVLDNSPTSEVWSQIQRVLA